MRPLRQQWSNVGYALGSPLVVLMLALSLGYVLISVFVENKLIVGISAFLFAAGIGIAGEMVGNTLQHFGEQNAIVSRGIMATRSLKTVLKRLLEIDRRFREGLSREDPYSKDSFEGLRDLVATLRDDTINSIENWADIIPDSNIRKEITELSNKENQ